MKVRAAVLTLLLGGVLVWYHLEQGQGKWKVAEQFFLDTLVANTRDTFIREMPATSPDVVLVEFREEEKAEFASWPPAPLDYIMVLKRLAEHQPEVVAVAEALRWDAPGTQFVGELRQAVLPFPSFVLGFNLAATPGEMLPDVAAFVAEEMPVLAGSDGDVHKAPVYNRVTTLPDKSVRIAGQLGFLSLEGDPGDGVLFAATDGQKLVPSFAAQVTGAFRHAPFAGQRLRFGSGARLSLGDEHVIPLDRRGSMELEDRPEVPRINALELMTPDVGDEEGRLTRSVLGKGKVVVMATVSSTGPPLGMQQARAVAQALAMPSLHRLDRLVDWAAALGAAILAFWQLRYQRLGALVFGFAVFVAGLATSLLVFQSSLVWWSPLPALAVGAVATVFCFVWPARNPVTPASEGEPVPAVPA